MQERVRKSSSERVNRKIDEKILKSIDHYATQDVASISDRIRELEKEWDIERVLEVNMPIVALIGLALGAFVNEWWLLFPVVVLLFFLQHALQGWCPPLPIFRSLGYRTKKEIERERYALKVLRGDFDEVVSTADPAHVTEDIYHAVTRS